MDEVRRSARSVWVHLQVSTCTVIPANLVPLQVGGGRPPLIATPGRPQGNKFRGALEDLSDPPFERRVVTEMPVSQPETHNELARVPVPDNSGNSCGRTSSRLTNLAALRITGPSRHDETYGPSGALYSVPRGSVSARPRSGSAGDQRGETTGRPCVGAEAIVAGRQASDILPCQVAIMLFPDLRLTGLDLGSLAERAWL